MSASGHLHPQQFSGVLHGVDSDDTRYSMPYSVSSRQEVLDASRYMAEQGARVTEHSHAGTCEEAGCRFDNPGSYRMKRR